MNIISTVYVLLKGLDADGNKKPMFVQYSNDDYCIGQKNT